MQRRSLTLSLLVLLVAGGCHAQAKPYPAPQQDYQPYRPTEHGGVVYDEYDTPSQTNQSGQVSAGNLNSVGQSGAPNSVEQNPQIVPAIPGSRVEAQGIAPIAKGDIVRAREQALAAAVRNAVERSAAIVAPGTPASSMSEVLTKPRRYVTRYSIIRESNEPEVSYTIDIDAEVDVDGLKSAIAAPGGSGASVHTIELSVANIRRAKDLRAIAQLLRADATVREVRQQSYKQQRAVLEVDCTGSTDDIASILRDFNSEDGVTITIDDVTPAAVKTTFKLPPRNP